MVEGVRSSGIFAPQPLALPSAPRTRDACEPPLEGVWTALPYNTSLRLPRPRCRFVTSAYSKRRVPRDKAMLLRTTTLLGLVGLVVAAATDIPVDPTHARALLVRSRSPSL